MKKTIINFTDLDVDGCNSNANVLIEVFGKQNVPKETITTIRKEIDYFIKNTNVWDTDDVINKGCAILETMGYSYNVISPDYNIEF
jgi:hypothetical protein